MRGEGRNDQLPYRAVTLLALMITLTALSVRVRADSQTTGTCGGQTITIPFADVAAGNIFFCSIAEAYFSGLTNGTSPTTYNPSDPVPREQMAAFVTRTLDQSLRRGSRRAALGQWWTNTISLSVVPVQQAPQYVVSNGTDLWVSNSSSQYVSRVSVNTGVVVGFIHSLPSPEDIVIVGTHIYIASFQNPGKIYFSYTSTTNAPADELATNVGSYPNGITYDGVNLWTANYGTVPGTGSISKVVQYPTTVVTTYTTGFSQPVSILFDGANLWVTDRGDNTLKRVDLNNGSVLETTSLGPNTDPRKPVFDGTNLWVPCFGTNELVVVRAVGAQRGTVLARLTGNGLSGPIETAFDGERVMVTNYNSANNSGSLWKATDLTPIGSLSVPFPTPKFPTGICSDGQDFWITLQGQIGANGEGALVRF